MDEQDKPLKRTVVCTSATLATNGAFEHFKARCGIEETGEELVLPTVFDFPRQALLYQPALPPFNYRASDAYYNAAAQEIERGVKTLALRMERQCQNTRVVADFLRQHELVDEVHYPGHESHPGFEVASRQMKDFGAMVSIELKGGRESAAVFLDNLNLFMQAVSLGDVCSLATHPASTTHQLVDEAERARQGVNESLVRLSVGIEDEVDLVADLEQALARVGEQLSTPA